MPIKKVYVVYKDEANSNPLGIYDRKGLLSFIKEQKKKAVWQYHREENKQGKIVIVSKTKIYPKLQIVSYPLNKPDHGTVDYEWYL